MYKVFFLYFTLFLVFLFRLIFLHPQNSFRAGQEVTLITTLSSEPQIYSKSQRLFLEEGLGVVTSRYPQYHYGDKLKIVGTTQTAKYSSLKSSLLRIKKSDLEMVFPQIEIVEEKKGSWLLGAIFSFRQKLITNYQEFLPEPASSLLTGTVLGVKTQMSADFKESLRKAGLTHVVVASGLNVTLVAGFLSGTLTFFLKRQLVLPLVLLGIVFYALLAGFEPPIVRAAIMGALAFAAQGFGRQNWGVLSLVLTGFLMLIMKPLLILDLGFQLSFLATAGLILIRPIIEKTWPFTILGRTPLLGESFTTTLSAQLATLPPILANFGYWSFLSILANALVLWTIPWIMGIGGLAGVLGLIFKPLGQLLSFATYPFLFYFEKITFLFARFPFFSLEIGKFSFFLSLSYFSFLTAVLLWLTKHRKEDKANGEPEG